MSATGLTCNACNKQFKNNAELKLHYQSDWHTFNLKRKVAGVPGVTESLFLAANQSAAQEKEKDKSSGSETPMLYSCVLCRKEYKSSKTHADHLKSRDHLMRASKVSSQSDDKALPQPRREADNAESEDELEKIDPEDEDEGAATL